MQIPFRERMTEEDMAVRQSVIASKIIFPTKHKLEQVQDAIKSEQEDTVLAQPTWRLFQSPDPGALVLDFVFPGHIGASIVNSTFDDKLMIQTDARIEDNQYSAAKCKIPPGKYLLHYKWNVSSEKSFDSLRAKVDGHEYLEVSGSTSGTVDKEIESINDIVLWFGFTKDCCVSEGRDNALFWDLIITDISKT